MKVANQLTKVSFFWSLVVEAATDRWSAAWLNGVSIDRLQMVVYQLVDDAFVLTFSSLLRSSNRTLQWHSSDLLGKRFWQNAKREIKTIIFWTKIIWWSSLCNAVRLGHSSGARKFFERVDFRACRWELKKTRFKTIWPKHTKRSFSQQCSSNV